jgi:hypothetical protein
MYKGDQIESSKRDKHADEYGSESWGFHFLTYNAALQRERLFAIRWKSLLEAS